MYHLRVSFIPKVNRENTSIMLKKWDDDYQADCSVGSAVLILHGNLATTEIDLATIMITCYQSANHRREDQSVVCKLLISKYWLCHS